MQIQNRLLWCMRHGNLTVADLARWLERPDPTVRGWVKNGGRVGAPEQDVQELERSLGQLETMIKTRRGFPVPRMSPIDRIAYLESLVQ